MLTINLFDLLANSAERCPNKIAIIDGKQEITYIELLRQVLQLSGYLYHLGVKENDKVGIWHSKSIKEVIAIFAISRLRATIISFSPQWTIQQIQRALNESHPKALIIDDIRQKGLRGKQRLGVDLIVSSANATLVDNIIHPWPTASYDIYGSPPLDQDVAMIIYTSGSTGYPKGVMLTNYNVLSSIRSTAYYLKNNSADRVLCLLPLSFNYGLGQLLCMVMVGGTTVLHHIPMASEIVNAFQYYEITGFAAVPTIWVDLTAYLQEEPVSFPKLKYITNAGGKCPTPTLKKLPLCFPDAKIYLMYGMTETVRSTFLDPLFFNHKIGSLGKAVPGAEIFVVDDNSHICKPKQVGEIVHRGSSVCLGYLKRDEETHKKLKPAYTIQGIAGNDLVCFSGDLGYQDEEGYFWFVGRKDMMIKVKGFRVSPDEIRDIFMHVQGVHDAIAFGLLNDDDIEEIHAVVVPEEKNSVQVDSLRGYCRSHMPGYMMPSHIHIWEKELPKTVNGKIDIQSIKASINNLFKNKETLSYVN